MTEALLWIYLINGTLIITHEIDSAYWKEWELFRLPGRINFFLVLHIFLVFIILLGIVLLIKNLLWGLVLSLILSIAGIFAFSIHRWFISKGHTEFKTPVSQSILFATLIVSLVQLVFTVYFFINGYSF
ncbi:MAG: hypothetical protein P8105_00820 [Dehalococcoidia bacterium]